MKKAVVIGSLATLAILAGGIIYGMKPEKRQPNQQETTQPTPVIKAESKTGEGKPLKTTVIFRKPQPEATQEAPQQTEPTEAPAEEPAPQPPKHHSFYNSPTVSCATPSPGQIDCR